MINMSDTVKTREMSNAELNTAVANILGLDFGTKGKVLRSLTGRNVQMSLEVENGAFDMLVRVKRYTNCVELVPLDDWAGNDGDAMRLTAYFPPGYFGLLHPSRPFAGMYGDKEDYWECVYDTDPIDNTLVGVNERSASRAICAALIARHLDKDNANVF